MLRISMPKCKECNDTGLILTESVQLSRPYYSHVHKYVVYDGYSEGDWVETICYCQSDKD